MKNTTEQIFDNMQNIADTYPTYTNAEKQKYWNTCFYRNLRTSGETGQDEGKIKISDFRQSITGELNIEKYALAWVEAWNEDEGFTTIEEKYKIEDFFILDDIAQNNLNNSLANNAIGKNISNILDGK